MRFTALVFVLVAMFAVFANGQEKDCGACIDLYQPVCAHLNNATRTFSNDCAIGTANCAEDAKWAKISDGTCP